MLTPIHVQMTRQALTGLFSARALQAIIAANLKLDDFGGQFGHDEYHFDNNAFDQGLAFIEQQRRQVLAALQAGDSPSAWASFGRLTHTAQDFYAHSNYIQMWFARHAHPTPPAPPEVDPVAADLLLSPDLHSGRLYYPQEILYFIPPLRKFALSILPRDSHAHMNLDSTERGPLFDYAFHAAIKRTRLEFEQTTAALDSQALKQFTDL